MDRFAMVTRWHKSLTPERWEKYPIERQILMIGTEFARAKALIQKGVTAEVKACYERAFELLDLCCYDRKWSTKLKELLRFREQLGELYIDPDLRAEKNLLFYHVLMTWNRETAKVEL